MLCTLTAAGIVLICLIHWYLREYSRYNSTLECIPGPPTLPLVGNALDFRSWAEFLEKAKLFYIKYGPVFKIRIGPIRPTVMVCDPKLIGFVLSSSKYIEKSSDYDYFRSWLGNGLLTSSGSVWRVHRKMITPAFHFKILEGFVSVLDANANILTESLKKEIGKSSFDIYPYVNLCALDSICETAMGVSINAQKQENTEYVKNVKEICKIFSERSVSVTSILFKPIYYLTNTYRREKEALKVLHGFTRSVIQKRKQDRSKLGRTTDVNEYGIKTKTVFLDLLLDAKDGEGNVFSDEEIREQVDTIMFGGHDTTSTAISFAVYCLAENPLVQRRVYEEIQSVIGDCHTTLEYADLQNMRYLEMVIKEVLRLYPSAPLFSREVQEEVLFDGLVIPEGTELCICPYITHRDPSVFPDPEKFDPDRFATTSGVPLYSFIPFSAGPRNCIGQKFAMMEMKILLTKIIVHYELLPASEHHELQPSVDVVLKSANGVHISIKKRCH